MSQNIVELKPKNSTVELTEQQNKAISHIVEMIDDGEPVTALKGLAGTGKTTLIPALKKGLESIGKSVKVGAPTHRAAIILQSKFNALNINIAVGTLHSLALAPIFSEEYQAASRYLDNLAADVENFKDAEIPELLKKHDIPQMDIIARLYGTPKALASRGIHGSKHIIGYGAKEDAGDVILIDEGSMVGSSTLQLCGDAFDQVLLVGDPGQLPPVKDRSILSTVPSFELTEIHRQAKDSPIIQMAHTIRNGVQMSTRMVGGDIKQASTLPASDLLYNPLLVWKNTTRKNATISARRALGYDDELVSGEPLICRSTSKSDREEGFFNNSMWRIVDVKDDRNILVVQEGEDIETAKPVKAHIEELDGDWISPDSIPFRFGYCMTVHTAQGSEWPRVYISMQDYRSLCGMAYHSDQHHLPPTWAYTAVTRAKQEIVLMNDLNME